MNLLHIRSCGLEEKLENLWVLIIKTTIIRRLVSVGHLLIIAVSEESLGFLVFIPSANPELGMVSDTEI